MGDKSGLKPGELAVIIHDVTLKFRGREGDLVIVLYPTPENFWANAVNCLAKDGEISMKTCRLARVAT